MHLGYRVLEVAVSPIFVPADLLPGSLTPNQGHIGRSGRLTYRVMLLFPHSHVNLPLVIDRLVVDRYQKQHSLRLPLARKGKGITIR